MWNGWRTTECPSYKWELISRVEAKVSVNVSVPLPPIM